LKARRMFERALIEAERLTMPLEQALAHFALSRALPDARAGGHRERAVAIVGGHGAAPWFCEEATPAADPEEVDGLGIT
jgi:hypothetical protein